MECAIVLWNWMQLGVEIDIDSLRSTKFDIDSDRMRTAMVRSGGNDAARYHAVIPGEVVL